MPRNSRTRPVTISNGASLSGAVYLGVLTLVAIQMPAAWTAASLTFQGSFDGVTYQDVYEVNGATETSYAAGASRSISFDPSVFVAYRYVKVRSGSSAAPVVQAADRTLTVQCASITS